MTGVPTRRRTGSSNPGPRPDSLRRSGAHITPHSGPCPHSSPARMLPWSAGVPTRRHPPSPSATPVASPAVRYHERDATRVVFGVSRSSDIHLTRRAREGDRLAAGSEGSRGQLHRRPAGNRVADFGDVRTHRTHQRPEGVGRCGGTATVGSTSPHRGFRTPGGGSRTSRCAWQSSGDNAHRADPLTPATPRASHAQPAVSGAGSTGGRSS